MSRRRYGFTPPHGGTGFTLIELLMVALLITIVAAVGIPQYTKAIERGYWRHGRDMLLTIYSGEQTYFTVNNAYKAIPAGSNMSVWRTIYMDNPYLASIPVNFTVTANSTAFTAYANRSGTQSLNINQDRQWCGGATEASCASWLYP